MDKSSRRYLSSAKDVADLGAFKERYSVPNECVLGILVTTDGYVFEGHVPAKYGSFENPPVQAMGLAVPGMPVGSRYGIKINSCYQVMQLNKDGTTQVYADIESVEQQL